MQKSVLASIILLVLSLTLSAQYTNTRLWRISGNGLTKSSYLFGSMHIDDERVFNFSDSLFYKLAECEAFANEIAFDSLVKYVYGSFDKTMQSKMQDEYFGDDEALDEISQSMGINKNTLKKVSPVILKQLIGGSSKSAKRKPAVLDSYLYNIAKKEGKICIGIENINTQTQLFEKLSADKKLEYTNYTLGKKNIISDESMIKFYRNADMKAIEEMLKSIPPEIFKTLFAERNIGMANMIDSISHKKSTFYTVGFGHLPGKEGLISLLQEKGYKVNPVIETFTGMAENFPFSNRETPWVTHVDSISGFQIDMPGPAYTSPDFPASIPHGICFDIGTNSMYMVVVRQAMAFGNIKDLDSLALSFVKTAWKKDLTKKDLKTIAHQGILFKEVNNLEYNPYYITLRIGVDEGSVIVLVSMNNQKGNTIESSRFFNTFKRIEKISKGWNYYHSEKGAYRILFPGNPKEQSIADTRNNSGTTANIITDVDNNTGAEYFVQYIDNRTNYYLNDTALMNLIVDGNLSEIKGERKNYHTLTKQGFPCRMFDIVTPQGNTLSFLLSLRGTRIYNVISSYLTNGADSLQVKQFFDSFHFTDYTYSNWTAQTSEQGKFSMLAPATFQLIDSINYSSKYSLSQAYSSYDENTADKMTITRMVYSPYYCETTDSAFFANKHLQSSDEGDTIRSQKLISSSPLTWELISNNPYTHLLTHSRYVLSGRNSYSVILMYPEVYKDIHPGIKALESFRISDIDTDGDLNTPKTRLLFAHLASNDTSVYKPAYEALGFYEFKPAEIDDLFDFLQPSLPDDSLQSESSRAIILRKLNELPDSIYLDKLYSKYDSVCPTAAAQLEALTLLSKNQDMSTLQFVKQKYLALPENEMYKSGFLLQLSDSSQYTAAFYPELFGTLSDTLNNYFMIPLTLELLRNKLLDINVIEPYKKSLMSFMQNLCNNPSQLYEYDYTTPKVFDIAGYFNDAEMNAFMDKNQTSKNKYIQYNILKSLISNNLKHNNKVLKTLAKDLEMRKSLYSYLRKLNKTDLIPAEYQTQESIAMSDMYNYLLEQDEQPQNIEWFDQKDITVNDTIQRYYLFKISYKWEDETEETAISNAGPYPVDGSIPEKAVENTGYYWSDDTKLTAKQHFEALEKSIKEIE